MFAIKTLTNQILVLIRDVCTQSITEYIPYYSTFCPSFEMYSKQFTCMPLHDQEYIDNNFLSKCTLQC